VPMQRCLGAPASKLRGIGAPAPMQRCFGAPFRCWVAGLATLFRFNPFVWVKFSRGLQKWFMSKELFEVLVESLDRFADL